MNGKVKILTVIVGVALPLVAAGISIGMAHMQISTNTQKLEGVFGRLDLRARLVDERFVGMARDRAGDREILIEIRSELKHLRKDLEKMRKP